MAGHTLILLRHGKSDWSGGEADIDRPLAPRGRRQAPESGRWLGSHVGRIDLAVVSPAERARATWALVADELSNVPDVRVDDRVYAATSWELLAVVQELPEDAAIAVLVGHNPSVEDLVTELTGEWVTMPTSALAVLELTGSWAEAAPGTATLKTSGRPPA